eukprot:699338-Rhodomonas_salina.1
MQCFDSNCMKNGECSTHCSLRFYYQKCKASADRSQQFALLCSGSLYPGNVQTEDRSSKSVTDSHSPERVAGFRIPVPVSGLRVRHPSRYEKDG